MMGLYEIMLVIRPDLEEGEQQEVLDGLFSTINKQQGEVNKVEDWLKRKLSYEINKLHEGHYYLIYFTGPGTMIPELEHYFRVTDAVIRYMVVKADPADISEKTMPVEVDISEEIVEPPELENQVDLVEP